jgi:hypothetical protein
MMMKFLLHPKDLKEITSRELLPPKFELFFKEALLKTICY